METKTPATMTNQEVGNLIGCTHSMASRLRAGKRLPGLPTLERIHETLEVPWEDLLLARRAGAPTFGKLLQSAVTEYAAKRATEQQ